MNSATPEGSGTGTGELRFQLYGKVQGVGFRWWTRAQAQRLGITGVVRNRPDGSVEVQARGTEAALQQFADILEKGAPGSTVLRMDQEPAEGVQRDSFEIAH